MPNGRISTSSHTFFSYFQPIIEDETSSKPAIATFNGYSASGDVTAELVYVNYGREEDFELLDRQNISVAGKIVIVRYGKIFRGNKVPLPIIIPISPL